MGKRSIPQYSPSSSSAIDNIWETKFQDEDIKPEPSLLIRALIDTSSKTGHQREARSVQAIQYDVQAPSLESEERSLYEESSQERIFAMRRKREAFEHLEGTRGIEQVTYNSLPLNKRPKRT